MNKTSICTYTSYQNVLFAINFFICFSNNSR